MGEGFYWAVCVFGDPSRPHPGLALHLRPMTKEVHPQASSTWTHSGENDD